MEFDTYNAECFENLQIDDRQFIITFKLDKELKFQPGQYMTVMFPGMKPAPFSIASSPASDRMQLAIEVVGPVTTELSKLEIGDMVPMKGPFGRFVLGDERKSCFIAGGIGVAPFMSMLRAIKDEGLDKEAVFLYSCRRPDQFLWPEELDLLTLEGNIKVVKTLTGDTEGWTGRSGRVTAQMIRGCMPDFEDYVYYVCGPLEMCSDMFEILQELGIPLKNLRREVWST